MYSCDALVYIAAIAIVYSCDGLVCTAAMG